MDGELHIPADLIIWDVKSDWGSLVRDARTKVTWKNMAPCRYHIPCPGCDGTAVPWPHTPGVYECTTCGQVGQLCLLGMN